MLDRITVHGARQRPVEQSKREIVAGKRPRTEDNPDCRIPDDAVPIDASRYQQLFEAQQRGKQIVVRSGKPMAIDPVASAEERAAAQRRQRDRLLAASDWTQLPDAPLTAAARKRWSAYRTRLRAFGTNLRESAMRMKRPSDLMLPVSPAEEGPVDTPS